MTQEVIRRHYLEAMGITAWASRYQLPNALPTEVCEWEESMPAPTPPRERLQALLDDAPAPRRAMPNPQAPKSQAPEPSGSGDGIASPSAVRALLGQEDKPAIAPADTSASTVEALPTKSAKPLQFALSCLCLNGRWLVVQAGEISAQERQLLANLLQAAGIQQDALSEVTHFTWPQMTNAFAVEDPLDEAREGVAAFIAGRVSRQGWRLERLLWWGELGAEQAPLDRIMNVTEGHCHTLSLPVWQGPALVSLLDGTSNKRDLWPALQALSQQWAANSSTGDQPDGARQSADDH